MKAELSPDLAPASVPLDDKLSEVAREERQRALRGLLQTPLLTADGTHAAEFGLVRRHADELRDWLAHHANWTLQVTSELARLRKTPPDSTDCTRAARDVRTDAPFTRSRYVLLCLALAALERSERQTTLGRLAEAMLGFFTADPSLAACVPSAVSRGVCSNPRSARWRSSRATSLSLSSSGTGAGAKSGERAAFIRGIRQWLGPDGSRPILQRRR